MYPPSCENDRTLCFVTDAKISYIHILFDIYMILPGSFPVNMLFPCVRKKTALRRSLRRSVLDQLRSMTEYMSMYAMIKMQRSTEKRTFRLKRFFFFPEKPVTFSFARALMSFSALSTDASSSRL